MSPPGAVTSLHLLAYTDSTGFGGSEKALATLVGALRWRIDVTVAGNDPEIVEAVAAARESARTRIMGPVRSKWDLRGSFGVLRAVREIRPDVLHANLGHPWSCQYALTAGLLTRGVKTVAVQHAILPPRRRRQVWLNRLNLKRLDAHVAVSSASARMVEKMAGLEPGSMRVIYNGVADPSIEAVPRPAEGPVIGSVGRLSDEKGYDVLLRALVDLPAATAVLVGDGPAREQLERLAAELEVAPRVVLAGWQDDPWPWLPSVDVFVLPSRSEALPLSIIEAMLASRPVVATAVGGVAELVTDGETGRVVPPDDPRALADAIRPLMEDSGVAERMGRAGRKRALEMFSVEHMVDAYESLYAELSGAPVPWAVAR